MSQYCKYHPKNQAAWFCQACETSFCSGCVPEDTENYFPKCTLCRRSLRSLSVAQRIPPFWTVLPSLIAKPLNAGVLLFATLFALVFALLPQGKIGLVLAILATIPVIELLFEVMERTASGEKIQKGAMSYLSFSVHSQSVKLLAGMGIVFAMLYQFFLANPPVGVFAIAFFVLGMPASLIILMMEKSVFSMFHPLKIGFLIKLFGSAYFLLYLIMLLVAYIGFKVTGITAESSMPMFGEVLLYFISLYLTISVAVMAGYLVYQYHHELNFVIDRKTLHQIQSDPQVDNMAEVDIFIQEGRYEDAQKLLLGRINENANDYQASEKLILLYAVQGKNDWIKKIADQYFDAMIAQKKQKQAVDFYQTMQNRGVLYSPVQVDIVTAMCREMQNKLQFKTALDLIENSLKENAKPKGWELLYIIKAKILVEYANRGSEAIEVLTQVINRSIDQELMQEAEDYLRLIG